MEKEIFTGWLAQLRRNKGVSSRDMSLSLCHSAGYINNIENGVNLPSITVFFYICDYLGITPKVFFDVENKNSTKAEELSNAIKGLDNEQMDNLISIARGLSRK